MNQTWRMLTLTLGLTVLASSHIRAEEAKASVAANDKSCCPASTCGRSGHDIIGWLTYCPIGRQMCTECSCLSRHGQRTPPLFAFFLDYPCPPGGELSATDGKTGHGHVHYVKHACTTCQGKSTGVIEEVKMLPAESKKMPTGDVKKMLAGDAK